MSAPVTRWRRILVHHSAGVDTRECEAHGIRRYHVEARGWRDCGYHFLVERVGEGWVALMGRPLHWEGSHCPGQNREAIGVCFIGDFDEEGPPEQALDVGARLIAGLCAVLGIPLDEIHPHRAYRATECPGAAFPLERLRHLVGQVGP